MKRNVPSSDVDRARELLSVLEDQEAIELQIEQGEEVWGGGPGKVGGGFGDGFQQGILQSFGLRPGLDSSQGRCPTVRRGLGIFCHEKALCGHQGHLGEDHPILGCLH